MIENTNFKIESDTPIKTLCKAGIVPEWMAEDCEKHGMYEAEHILCEWDWEDGWDLGQGYNKQQLEVLSNVRRIIHEALGIDKRWLKIG